ncbi:MAG: DUF2254 domain-containing protein [Methanosarcinales archaeon]|nr:DUF2254 domain-containing protein [Methanosarcinales archaeon]
MKFKEHMISIWAIRLAVYFILFLIIYFLSMFAASSLGLLYTNVDSARYMISALIQSEAAIIAIVITLTLVAFQTAASSYSIRVINVLINKNPDFWILLLIYIAAMIHGLFILKRIDEIGTTGQSNLEYDIFVVYIFGAFAFIMLLPYMYYTLNLLKPSTIIQMLAEEITKNNIMSAIGDKDGKNNIEDPMQPLVDIVYSALMKYDYGTARDGLRAIENRIGIILGKGSINPYIQTLAYKLHINGLVQRWVNRKTLEHKNFDAGEEHKISEHVFGHLLPVGKLALSRSDEISINHATNTIREVGRIAAKNRREWVTLNAIENLEYIGIEAVSRNLGWPAGVAVTAIEKIGKISIEKELKEHTIEAGWWEVSSLEKIGAKAIENRSEHVAQQVAGSLGLLGMNAAEKDLKKTLSKSIKSLANMSECAKKEGLCKVMETTSESLNWIIGASLNLDESKEALSASAKVNASIKEICDKKDK